MSPAEQVAAAAKTATHEESILDSLLGAAKIRDKSEAEQANKTFKTFLEQAVKPGQVVSKEVDQNIKHWIAQIDKKLSSQLNEIMHDAAFQKLEGTWRGIKYLTDQSETGENLKIKVLNVSKKDLFKDLERAVEFDQSALFKKVYEDEYGTLGGEPYGMLVGDYEFDRSAEDISLLKMIAGCAAQAHAPFASAASPKLMNLDSFTDLSKPRDLAKIFMGVEYAAWKSFRESEDSRYVALTMPRVLGRLPYGEGFKSSEEFVFQEQVDGKEHTNYLWMNSAWAYASRVTAAFAETGWMARTRGVEGGGKVEGLPVHTFATDDGDLAMKCPTEIAISDRREFELSNLGFLPLLHAKNRDFAAFLGSQSCQKPKEYANPEANTNAQLSTKFNFLLVTSRFAHYLKVMARNWIGSNMEVFDVNKKLNEWVNEYVLEAPEAAGDQLKAEKPLAAANVEVTPVPGRPGWYKTTIQLRPHYQLETLTASLRLVGNVKKSGG